MRIILLWISLSLFIQERLATTHEYAHDDIRDTYSVEVSEFTPEMQQLRNLQNLLPRKMLITYDMSQLDTLDFDDPYNVKFKYLCERALKIAISFFSDLLTVIPRGSKNMKWGKKDVCAKIPISAEDKEKGKKNSDLHLYISYGENTVPVLASWCRFLTGIGPTHGFVEFSKEILKMKDVSKPFAFYKLVDQVIHELTHVLGFYNKDIKLWVNDIKQPHVNPTSVQLIRGLNTTVLQTPHVKEFARKYYGCSNLMGMPLENQKNPNNPGSHWETTILSNELLNVSGTSFYRILSGFTIAMFKDTGFYFSVNHDLEEESFYGRDKGCTFVTGECDNTQNEYCNTDKNGCDYYAIYISTCSEKGYQDLGCRQFRPNLQGGCDNKNNLQNEESIVQKYGVSFGQFSRCFMSSLARQVEVQEGGQQQQEEEEQQPFCFNSICNDQNEVVIYVGDKKVVCSLNNQIVTIPTWNGQLRCPNDISQFCNQKKQCPNYCSANGYCNKGICKCLEGYTGEDCSVKIE